MEKIKSFTVDHDDHGKGFYLSNNYRNILTYDLRFKTPNDGDFIAPAALHTIEHLFATAVRNGEAKDDVIYFGPMGCRTGFYLLLDGIEYEKAKKLTLETLETCLGFEDIPGATRKECGNYKEHDLKNAKREIENYIAVLKKS